MRYAHIAVFCPAGSLANYRVRMIMFVLHIFWNLLVILSLTDGFITQSRLVIEQKPRHRRGCARMVGEGYLTWLSKRIELAQRPPFIKFTRARITRDFAVLLMRTSYQVCDELDFVPMDDFQKQFFLFRQDEWSPYKENFPRIKQGDLTDPDYFDFISFAQYATIAMTMRNGRDIFEEKVGAEGDRRTVQRDPDLMDNARLPEEHERRVGEKLLAYCTDTFGPTKLAPVIGQGLSMDDLQEGCNRVMNLLRLNFYLLDFSVGSQVDRRVLTVKATAPATIWGQQVLAQRRDRPTNDFEAKAVLAYLRACGIVGATYSTAFNGLDVVHTFRV